MKAGELYGYAPDAGKWCRHGLRLVTEGRDGKLWARDTYWGSGEYSDPQPVEMIADHLEFVLDLSNAELVSRDRYEQYAEKDRAYIPIGGGSAQYWVSKSAKPDPQKIREQLKSRLEDAEAELQSAQRHLDWVRKELAEFEALEGKA